MPPALRTRARMLAGILLALAVAVPISVKLAADPAPPVPLIAADTEPPLGDFPGATTITLPDDDGAGLTRAARTRATRAALADPRVRAMAPADRSAVVLVTPLAPYERDAACSCIAVTIYDYGDDSSLDALVDPATWRVVSVEPSAGRPPLSAAERRRAHRIAEADPRVRALLHGARHVHPALASPLWPDGSACDRGRCASVIFLIDGLATSEHGRQIHALIDLSRGRVIERRVLACDPECAPEGSR